MKHLDALCAARLALHDANGSLLALAEKEDRALTAAEAALFDERNAQVDELTEQIDSAGTRRNPLGGSRSGGDDGGFESLGEMMQCLGRLTRGEGLDDRLAELKVSAATMGSSSGGGGFLLPGAFQLGLFDKGSVPAEFPLLSRCTTVPMSNPTISAPGFADNSHAVSPHGIDWATIPEGGSFGSYQSIDAEEVTLTCHKTGAVFSANREWIDDSGPEVRKMLEDAWVGSLRWHIESKLWGGIGASEALGVLRAPSLIAVDPEDGQAAATITATNITDMYSRLRSGADGAAFWAANRTCLPQLLSLYWPIGTAGVPAGIVDRGSINGRPTMAILGLDLVLTEHLPTLGNQGDIMLIDPRPLLLGDRRQIVLDASEHALFSSDKIAFRTSVRYDATPTPRTTFQPANGSTLSPYVTLAERT